MRAKVIAAAAGVLLTALTGCSSGPSAPPAPLCPRVGIIGGLESLERQAGGGSGQVAYRAAMENVDGACRAEGNDLVVDITIDLVVQPGPGIGGTLVELPYFVAVSAPNGDLLDRQDFVGKINVPRGSRSAGVTETFTQRFIGRREGASGYQVLFGFDLPEGEALRQRESLTR
jgi:hypothetical protein